MCRKSKIRCCGLIYFVLVLAFVISSSVGAKTIIWVSDNKTPTGGVAADQAWVDLLRAQGYTVDYKGQGGSGDAGYRHWRTLDAAKIAELNAADLIIVSRDTDSGNYDDGEEPTQWNSITTPLIMQIGHIARSNRWGWLDTTGTNDSFPPAMEAVELAHPVFTGVTLGANNQVSVITEASSFANTTDAGNGRLIGRRADNGQVWIVEWETGQEFYAGSGQTAAGPRMHFASGTDSGVDGRYNLTAEGEKLFLNAVRYMLGELGVEPGKASNPDPADGVTDVPRDVTLSWTPGVYAPAVNGHKVYLSENFNDVNDGIGGITHDANNYTPPQLLDFGKTYYWRVDEVNAPPDSTIFKGDVWSFTAEPFNYPVENIIATASSSKSADEGPENTINGSGLGDNDLHSEESTTMWLSSAADPNAAWIQYEFDRIYKLHQMWVWNYNVGFESILGFGLKDVTIEYSTDGADWKTLDGVPEFARAPGTSGYAYNTTVDLGGVVAKYVKITANSNWGGIAPQYGLSEVRFLHIPVVAREPDPASGTTDVGVDNVTLSWRAGREAATHNLYFSTDEQAVINESINPVSIPADRSYTSYDTGALDLDQTYYWKINEVNEAGTPTTWQGDVLNFSTLEYLVVDDIEDYNDFEPDRIFDTWIDGWNVPENGSQVGSAEPPFAEQNIVHGGKQAMALHYDNTTAGYSEATANVANLKAGKDWTKYGIKALSLWFYGDPCSVAEQMYVKLNGVKVLYDGDADNLTRTAWQQWNIDLKDFTGVNLSNVTELSIGLERSGVAGGKGAFYFDDIWLYPPRCIPSLLKPAADFDDNCTVNYLDLEIMAGDWLLNDYTLATAAPNPAGLIGHWPFDGNLNDISGNGSNGNPSGSPLYVAGHIGQAISLNGATQGVAVSGFSQIQGVSEVTIAMWAKTDVVTGTHTMWFTDQADGYGRTRCRVNNGNWQWIYGQAATSENIQITSPATAGVWTHFTGVRSNNNKLELFIDGVSKGTQPFAEPGPHSDQSSIGGERRSPTDIRDRFDGLIDDVRVYKYALSAAEAAYLADESPGDGQLYVPVQSVADLYNAEPVYYRGINFKDYAVLVDGWLDKQLWPAE